MTLQKPEKIQSIEDFECPEDCFGCEMSVCLLQCLWIPKEELQPQKAEFRKVLEGLKQHEQEYINITGIRESGVNIRLIDEALEQY